MFELKHEYTLIFVLEKESILYAIIACFLYSNQLILFNSKKILIWCGN
ncbi:MAG: hypothetical protein Q7S21_05505 [archaeon]|nr:hypothetical protein [archaeon]